MKAIRLLLVGFSPQEVERIRGMMARVRDELTVLFSVEVRGWQDRIGSDREGIGWADVILADVGSGGAAGQRSLERLLSLAQGKPVLVLCDANAEEAGLQAVRMGAQDYLVRSSLDTWILVHSIKCAMERNLLQRAIRDNEERLRHLLASLPTYIYRVNLDGGKTVSTEHTPACQAVTGYTPADYSADPDLWIKMVHPEDRRLVQEYVRKIMAGEAPPPIEHRIYKKDGTLAWVRNTVVRHFDSEGRLVGYDGLVEDITPRKLAEEALRVAHDELDAKVKARTAELIRANRELSEAVRRLQEHDKARSEFVSNVSHELKSPIATMTYAIENLMNNVAGPLSDRVKNYLVMLREECQRLDRTTDDILDMSRIENRTLILNRERIPIGPLVLKAVALLSPQAERKQQKIVVSPIPSNLFAFCDVERMHRVLRNILHNAIKFTPGGGIIEILVRPVPAASWGSGGDTGRDDSLKSTWPVREIEICTIDNGVGIPHELLGRVTERYFRVDEGVSGTGLGLAICKEITELHGGRLEIASPPPGRTCGTQVSVRLPAAAPVAVGVLANETGLRSFVVQTLVKNGFNLKVYESIESLLQGERPDIVLLELDSSKGLETVARLRSEARMARVPIVAVGQEDRTPDYKTVVEGLGIPFVSFPAEEETLLRCLADAVLTGNRLLVSRF